MTGARLLLVVLLLAACGGPQPGTPSASSGTASHGSSSGAHPVWVERGNWVAEWSAYVPNETTTADGKRVTTQTPAPGAQQQVRDADAPSLVRSGSSRAAAAKIGMAAVALAPGTIDLRVGDVAERNVLHDQLEAIGTIGDSARVYWTRRRRTVRTENGQAVEIPFSTVFIEGVHPGRTEISLHYPDSVRQSLIVTVAERAP